jgi:hypothetical protein
VSEDDIPDPDRAAILARRRRFIALAISGLAAGGCKHGAPEPCLSVPMPEGNEGEPEGEGEDQGVPEEPGPFVEDPGAPVDGGGTEGESGETEPKPQPQPCLKVQPNPQPCLKVKAPPHPCLMIMKHNGET